MAVKFKLIFLICLAGVFVFCFSNKVMASDAPKIYAQELQISEVNNGQIKGNFTVWNSDTYYYPDLNCEIKLFQGADFANLKLIDIQVLNETLSISPNGEVAKSFTYQYPKNIISGDYTLRVQIITAKGSELGWSDQIVALKGENKFLDILYNFSKVFVGKEDALPGEGVDVSVGQDVVAFLKVENSGDAITVVPKIKIFKRMFNMPLVKEYNGSSITFAKGETKEIKLLMPKLSEPESYLAEVKFYQNNEQVSGVQYFRWVVKGEGGKILYVKTDKDSYKAGEEMKIIISYVGPADLTGIRGAKLEVVVYDQSKNIIYKTSKDVDLTFDSASTTITVPVAKDLLNPMVEASITAGGKILDDYKIKLPIYSDQAKQFERKQAETRKYFIYLIFALLLVILAIAFLFFKFKNKWGR